MPTVDAELAKTGKYKIAWNEAYGGTLAKIGSELETMQQGISDMGIVATVFSRPSCRSTRHVLRAFGRRTPMWTKSIDYVQALPELTAEWTSSAWCTSRFLDRQLRHRTNSRSPHRGPQGKEDRRRRPNLAWFKNTGAVGVQGSLNTFYNDIKTGCTTRGGVRYIGRAGEASSRAALHRDQFGRCTPARWRSTRVAGTSFPKR